MNLRMSEDDFILVITFWWRWRMWVCQERLWWKIRPKCLWVLVSERWILLKNKGGCIFLWLDIVITAVLEGLKLIFQTFDHIQSLTVELNGRVFRQLLFRKLGKRFLQTSISFYLWGLVEFCWICPWYSRSCILSLVHPNIDCQWFK